MRNKRIIFIILALTFAALLLFSCDSTSSDTEPPTVAITYPANNSEFVQGTVINITAEATDNEEVDKVEFYVDGSKVSTDNYEPYKYEWDTVDILETHTVYAKAYDTNDNTKTSEVINITLEPSGSPPNPPSNPNPANNATFVSTNTTLSWACSDPEDDSLTYDIYFGTSSNPPLVNPGQSSTTYDPGTLNAETTHYWKIKAHDDHYNSATGDIWQFTTHSDGIVVDIDCNIYQTIIIGNQEWMAENLKVTHYRNGDSIPNVTSGSTWAGLSSGAYCYYNNNPSNGDTYGALYNGYAVNDSRGIAPEGWHVPTDDEIKELEMYLGMSQSQANNYGYRGTNEGSKLAGGYELWDNGDLRNDPEFDTSGFSFLPGGYRDYHDGFFTHMGNRGYFWSSTDIGYDNTWHRSLYHYRTTVFRYSYVEERGFSVRCVRD